MMSPESIRHIAIVGGGTAGWITAAALSHALRKLDCKISLIESADIGRIGVGEATIPPIVDFIRYLGINESEFIKATNASFKLGIKFQDWHAQGASYWHPFGTIGVNIDGRDFLPYWLKANRDSRASFYTDFSPAAVMGDMNRFYHPQKASRDSFLAGASYAYHFDANLVAEFLRAHAEKNGVERIEDRVTDVILNDRGFIEHLTLERHESIAADFYIDCSGFSALLIGKTLQSHYEDWSEYLPCDRAIAVPSENVGELTPYTLSTARAAGWTWRIPLQNRTGNGYVYSSQFCPDEQAQDTLMQALEGKALAEPRIIPFTTGCRREIWKHNCLAIGLSAGFVEPLESTAIHLITKGVKTFLNLFPDRHCKPELAREYNRIMYNDYEGIRDFIVLHYCTSVRDDTPFWRWCRQDMKVPDTLRERIALFRAQGKLLDNPGELFKAPSWHSVFLGMGVMPESHDPLIDHTDLAQVHRIMDQVKNLMTEMAKGLPAHSDYLKTL